MSVRIPMRFLHEGEQSVITQVRVGDRCRDSPVPGLAIKPSIPGVQPVDELGGSLQVAHVLNERVVLVDVLASRLGSGALNQREQFVYALEADAAQYRALSDGT